MNYARTRIPHSPPVTRHLLLVVAALAAATASDAAAGPADGPSASAIRWNDGTWDETGAPRGRLLTGNQGWFGPRVHPGATGLTARAQQLLAGSGAGYSFMRSTYDKNPNKNQFGAGGLRKRPVPAGSPFVADYDFGREMVFNEVDLLSRWGDDGGVELSFSADNADWTEPRREALANGVNRIRFDTPARGRYMRATITGGTNTCVESIVAWGDAADGDDGHLSVKPVDGGDILRFPGAKGDGVAILPMSFPYLSVPKPEGATPERAALRMARGEFESRYFAVVNCSRETRTVSIEKPSFGGALSPELYVGGVIKVKRRPKKLSEQEMLVFATTNRVIGADRDVCDIRPFIAEGTALDRGFLRGHFANAAQIEGFPGSVPIGPGEGCVVMLRLKTEAETPPGVYRGELSAGGTALPVEVDVVDLALVPQPWVMQAYAPFTTQFPYETRRRFDRDVARYAECGRTTVDTPPHRGSKEEAFLKDYAGPLAVITSADYWCGKDLFRKLARGQFSLTNAADVARLAADVRGYADELRALGCPPSRAALMLRDEPGPGSIQSVLESGVVAKEVEPELRLFSNPCFILADKGKIRRATSDEILKAVDSDLYKRVVDISVPVEDLARRPELRDLWYDDRPGRLNANYQHPAPFYNATSAFWMLDLGLNAWSFFAYSDICANDPYDPDTYANAGMSYTLVFPLEHDVAITADYESLRECAETVRLAETVGRKGDGGWLKELRKAYAGMCDRTSSWYPKGAFGHPDFIDFRDKVLERYSTESRRPPQSPRPATAPRESE